MNASRLSENALRKKLQNLEQQSRNIDQQHRVIKLELQRRVRNAQQRRPAPTLNQLFIRAQKNYNHSRTQVQRPYKVTRSDIIGLVDSINPPLQNRDALARKLTQFAIARLQNGIVDAARMGGQTRAARNAITQSQASIRNLQRAA